MMLFSGLLHSTKGHMENYRGSAHVLDVVSGFYKVFPPENRACSSNRTRLVERACRATVGGSRAHGSMV